MNTTIQLLYNKSINNLLLVCLLSSSINGISVSSTFNGYEELGSCLIGTGIIKLAVITPS